MKKFITAAVIVLVIVGIIFGVKFLIGSLSNPAAQVGCVDQDKIFASEKFAGALKQYETFAKEVYDLYNKKAKDLSKAKQSELLITYQQQLEQKRAVLLNPLKERVEAAIEVVAGKSGMSVVVDKKISVYGIKDITDDVIKMVGSEKELKLSSLPAKFNSPVGYFDQEVIRRLKAFRDADEKLAAYYKGLQGQIEAQIKKLGSKEREKLTRQYEMDFYKKRAEIYSPVNDTVIKVVEQISKNKGLSLILSKNSIMFGGVNVTEEVVKEFRAQTEK
ncbi:MAG: OmpH family outer membrane protein [Armatimonadota bacterium]